MEAGQLREPVALQYSDHNKPALPYFQELPHPARIDTYKREVFRPV
jgi:hypothetical protein